MLEILAAGSRLYVLASDRDQGNLLLDSIRGFALRTPLLDGAFEFTRTTVTAVRSGSVLEVLAADAASSWGLRPQLVFLDELAWWPETRASKELYESLTTAIDKTSGRLVITTTAGDPTHWAHSVLEHARQDPLWYVQEIGGPPAWIAKERIDEQERRLPPSTFRRLFLNEWTGAEDRLTSLEAVHACVRDYTVRLPDSSREYVIGVDLGFVNDQTAIVVAHGEPPEAPGSNLPQVVVDAVECWRGTHQEPVKLQDVEEWISTTAARYRADVLVDVYQAIGLIERLRQRGIRARKFDITQQLAGRLATILFTLIRDGRLILPADEALIDELLHLRIVDAGLGKYRIDHDSGRHDDQAIALALAAHGILDRWARPGPRLRVLRSAPPRSRFAPRL
jgi:phage terminase large subunit-like protein